MSNIVKIGTWFGAVMMLLLADISRCQAADTPCDSLTFSLFFRLNDDLLLRQYRSNEQTLDRIDQLLKKITAQRMKHIYIVGSSSPNGNEDQNLELAQRRARAIRGYIRWKHKHIPQESIEISFVTDFLPDWQRAVEQDLNVPRRDKVLEILQTEASLATKWANIQLLAGGAAEYMEKNMFPPMRNAISCMIVLKENPPKRKEETTTIAPTVDSMVDSEQVELLAKYMAMYMASMQEKATKPDTIIEPVADTVTESIVDIVAEPQIAPKPIVLADTYINKPLFALKTNLLFNAATLLNVELEVPIGKRWSIAGEWMFPWWLWEKQQNCLQVMSGTIEGRYWLGNRDVKRDGSTRQQLTGWFLGLYAGGGYYDLEWERKGYQGEFFVAAGISGGYAHTVNKKGTLRMEYSLGVGYMQTNYHQYEAKYGADNEWHLYRQKSGKYTWIGPTRAKISLVWMLDTNLFKKRGGAR